ncbi:MAG: YbhB/YbcL family Raf kinase inhibitor-like protein [Candidatus Binatia bacterium]
MRRACAAVLLLGLIIAEPRRGACAGSLALSSPAFGPGAAIPRRHTCDGEDLSPPLAWTGVPEAPRAFALIVDDPDAPAGTWTHWVLYDLPSTTTSLPGSIAGRDTLAGGGEQGANDFRRTGWGGPCPPLGKPHRYRFHLYALDAPTGLAPGARRSEVLAAIRGHVIGEAELDGTYQRSEAKVGRYLPGNALEVLDWS